MSGTADAPFDFTLSDDEDDYGAASDMENQRSLNASLKRRMSDSSMQDFIDQDQLHQSIEEDVLGPISMRPSWSFGKIPKPNMPQQQSMTPDSSQDSGINSTRSSQASLDNEYAFSNKQAQTRINRQGLEYSRASYEDQAYIEDLHKSSAEPSDSSQPPPKRSRHNPFPTSDMPATTKSGQCPPTQKPRPSSTAQDSEFHISDSDYLDDDGLNALLKSMVPLSNDADAENELPPDTEQEVIDFEAEEAAEAAEEEDEDEAANSFMNAIAVDETNQDLMDIIEISSDEDGDVVKERRQPQSRVRRESIRPSSIPKFTLNIRLTEIKHGEYTYKVGHGVEFVNGTFLRIKSIYRGHLGEVKLAGPLLIRHLHHVLDPAQPRSTRLFPSSGRQNEVIWTITVDGAPRSDFVRRDLSDALRPRGIVFTNQSWPSNSSQVHTGNRQRGTSALLNEGKLFCRWKRVKVNQVKHQQEYEESIERLTEGEADPNDRIKASKLRFAWRRVHVPADGGSAGHIQQFIAVDDPDKMVKINQYTFADCFCGCGGTSRGAELANLFIKWAIDADIKAAQSYRANFKSANCHHEDVSEFLSRLGEPGAAAKYMVDILHMSPPCQAFSPARTNGCPIAKEHLEALLLSVGDLLKAVKPRIATMEETHGLIERHKDWFTCLTRSIIDNGYSVRWTVLKSETLGVPQTRKRVVIIAAGPGEALPPFPKATHGPTSASKRRLATIHDAISNIPPRATHNKVVMGFRDPKPRAAYSPHTQAHTITCGGSRNPHPNGLRSFTAREIACLQTFPFMHSFANANLTTARKQIGNAYPPAMARAVFKTIIQSLQETDGVQ
jgi:DNA (cytosine-5)-methyltransferase 1